MERSMNYDNLILAAFFNPKIESPNGWHGHLPFACWIVNEVKPKLLVELGTHTGNSYLSFCQAVQENNLNTKCFAVDTWQGDEHAGFYGDEIFQNLNSYHQEHYSSFSRLLRMTFDSAVNNFSDNSIDLLHIDGLHSYEAVKHDFESWLPRLSPGAIVLFHDTNVREIGFGVWNFWEELKSIYPLNFEFLRSNGLGVIQLGNGAVECQLSWLKPDFKSKHIIREYFSALGKNQNNRYELRELINIYNSVKKVNVKKTCIYIDTGNGFNELDKLSNDVDLITRNFSISFDLKSFPNVKQFRFDPFEEHWGKAKIDKIICEDLSEEKHVVDLNIVTYNGKIDDNGFVVFETFDPMFFIPIAGNFNRVTFEGEWELFQLNYVEGKVNANIGELESTKGELESTKGELKSTKGELESTKGELESTKGELKSTKGELESTKGELESTKGELESTKGELESTKGELESTKGELESTKDELESTKNELVSMYLSKSWKWTRPLRKTQKLFKKLKRLI
jgi:hypothetical protein